MTPRLHLLLSPAASAWRDCCGQLADGDCLLLADRGVELLADPRRLEELANHSRIRLHALRDDVEARGLATLAEHPADLQLDAGQWIRLIVAHRHILSWT